ncbi:MAG: LamG-like jellyroll fold domain-containing protein, partial [Verrucomicrobiota bacterium]
MRRSIQTLGSLSLLLVLMGANLAAPAPARAAEGSLLRDKTLVAWVRLDNLNQAGSGVLAIQAGDEFDAITFGEQVTRRWMAGSHGFRRTQGKEGQSLLAPETASTNQWLQITVVYRGQQVEIWREGKRYAAYEAPHQQTYSRKCDLYLGLRCIFGQKPYGCLEGAIDEARIYDLALDGEAIAKLKPRILTEPKPLGCWTFDDGIAKDLMGHYPTTQLIGTAKVKDGALVLDGKGYALVSSRLIPEYRPTKVQAGFYTPPHRPGEMWDTWLYWHKGVYYMYYIAGPFNGWDAHEIAVSPDGVHWDYHGVAVKPRPRTAWIGTGHVWKAPTFEQTGLWILNYSEWVGDKQDIMFATSPDLVRWTKVEEGLRFVQDTRWYKEKGRWDCIDAVQGDDGWLYGYFTADPDPAKVNYPHCGFGFARSKDGLRWEAQPPVRGDMNGEFGGVQKIGDRYYITLSEGRIGVGDSPKGPFVGQKKNHNVFGGSIYFPRFFHTAPGGPLMNHFYTAGPIYAGPLKAIDIDHEGILRLVWWPGNEKLKAAVTPGKVRAPQGPVRWLEDTIDVNQTTVIEGTVRVPGPGQPGPALRGLLINQGNDTAECVSFEQTQTLFGEVQLDAQPMKLTPRQSANRDLDFGRDQKFRILLHRDMMEVYVNDYLTILVRVRNTGRLGLLAGDDPNSIRDIRIWRSANEGEAACKSLSKVEFTPKLMK